MRCSNCGADIPEGMLICPDCRTEVQIVPDYNPLDDVLAREVKGSVEGATRQINSADLRRYRNGGRGYDRSTRVLNQGNEREYGNSTRVLSQRELDRIRSECMRNTAKIRTNTGSRYSTDGRSRRNIGDTGLHTDNRQRTGEMRRNTGNMRQNTGSVRSNTDSLRQNTGAIRRDAEEKRRQQAARKKRAAKKRRQKVLVILLFLIVFLGAAGVLIYQNSYNGVVNKAYRSMQAGEYSAAEKSFNRAIAKDPKKAEAYTGLTELYIAQDETDQAEELLLNAIDSQPENVDLYEAAIQFYINTEQLEKISELLEGCDDSVLSAVSDYVSSMPEFSLKEGTYTEVQQVSLSSDGQIYYTTDGSEPDTGSTLYTEPILLNEGTTIIKAISVNENNIPSLTVSRTYTVEIPIEDAPAVSPSTGQYSEPTQITITVPEGYTAYYTMDGTTPSASSTQYTGPIDMPEGQTIFSAVLISKSGKTTQVTKRNYVLEY